MRINKRHLMRFLTAILLISGAASLVTGIFYQLCLNKVYANLNNLNAQIQYLEDVHAKTIPRVLFEWKTSLEAMIPMLKTMITVLLIPGLVLLILGVFAFYKTISVKAIDTSRGMPKMEPARGHNGNNAWCLLLL